MRCPRCKETVDQYDERPERRRASCSWFHQGCADASLADNLAHRRERDSRLKAQSYDGVYLVLNPSTERLKIGISSDVLKRCLALAAGAGTQVVVIGLLEGGYAIEQELHWKFASAHALFEWFENDPAIVEHFKKEGAPRARVDAVNTALTEGIKRSRDNFRLRLEKRFLRAA